MPIMNEKNLVSCSGRYEKNEIFRAGKRVIIYGVGNIGKKVYAVLNKHSIPVYCFLDKVAGKNDMADLAPTYHPDDFPLPEGDKNDFILFIAIFNRNSDIESIRRYLQQRNFVNIYTFLDFYQYFQLNGGRHYWLSDLSIFRNNINAIENTHQRLHDQASRDLYEKIITYRITQNPALCPQPTNATQYFDKNIISLNADTAFIDCGAYNGDTLQSLEKNIGMVSRIVAFEPDMSNFQQLCAFVKKHEKLAGEVFLWPCGVWENTEDVAFYDGQGEASALNPRSGNGKKTNCVSLDEVLQGFSPTFIKMDIEGAEYNALLGAKNIILKNMPDLAICVYHKPDHLWSICELLHEWNVGYRFFLRLYAYNTFELVLYAVRDR
jgi:FkbM family methyltransferase